MNLGYRSVRTAEYAYRHLQTIGTRKNVGYSGSVRIERRDLWNPLLKQQHGCLEQRVRLKPLLHWTVQDQISQREEAHSLVMRHERLHYCARLTMRQT